GDHGRDSRPARSAERRGANHSDGNARERSRRSHEAAHLTPRWQGPQRREVTAMLAWWRTVRLSIKSLLLHPLRSSLTVLGIFIGVASVIWLLAIGEGIGRAAEDKIVEMGARNIILSTVKPSGEQAGEGGYGLTRDRKSTRLNSSH